MKWSEFKAVGDGLIKEHGDLDVKGKMATPGVTIFGDITIVLQSTTNYATPKPHKVTEHFEVRHVDFVKDREDG
jgi:hypothetical protein